MNVKAADQGLEYLKEKHETGFRTTCDYQYHCYNHTGRRIEKTLIGIS